MAANTITLVFGFGANLIRIEDGDAATAEPNQVPVGEIAEDLGGGLSGGAGQGGDLFIGQGNHDAAGPDSVAALLPGKRGQCSGDALGNVS